MIRTFIAIDVNDAARNMLTQVQNGLKPLVPPRSVRWVAPQNIHLTLHFLGNIEEETVPAIETALSEVGAATTPFTLRVGGLGCFPNTRRPRVIWVGLLEKLPALLQMQAQLGEALNKAIGFEPETRPYSPHFTLGYTNKNTPSRQIKQLAGVMQAETAKKGPQATLPVEAITLMQSELRPGGPVYKPLSHVALSG